MQQSTPIEQSWTAHGIDAREATFGFNSLAHALLRRLESVPDKLFMVYYDEEGNRSEYTYGQFCTRVLRTATLLSRHGITRSSRVVIAAYNHPDTIVQYFASWCLGACAVPLNMSEDDKRLHYIVEHSRAKIVLCRSEFKERMTSVCEKIHVPMIEVGAEHAQQVEQCECFVPSNEIMLSDECMMVYTSGTTGNPKGVVLMQRNLMADGEGIAAWHGIDASQRMMCVLPVHHVNGCIVTHVTPFLAGASVVLTRRFQTENFFRRISDERVNIVSVVPTLLAFLLDANADDWNAVQRGLRHIICGAGPLTCELVRRFEERYSIPVMHGYGLSETTCYSCFLETDLSESEHAYWLQHFGFPSIGTPIPQNEMAIHNDQGQSLAANERGEIVIRGWNVMKEYDSNPDANDSAFAHGWFRSGDEGFWVPSPSGKPYFFITGRLKELIIRGGVNIAPLEIDEVINRAPGVRAGISVGFENDFYGEEVGALVIPMAEAREADILSFCLQELSYAKAPKVVLFADALPVTSTGKYQRNKVKGLFTQWKSVQFRKH